jgi:hypothetical protein
MKHNPTLPTIAPSPNEQDIRDYAFHLYQQSSCTPGHDLDNWLEATACLNANIPSHNSSTRLHRHVNAPKSGELHARTTEASHFNS